MAVSYEKNVRPHLDAIAGLARRGTTDREIARIVGVHQNTLLKYAGLHEELKWALSQSREMADAEVENALWRRAIGYSYIEKTWERHYDEETGQVRLVVSKKVEKQVAPDVNAIMYYLGNRRPDFWKYKPESMNSKDNNDVKIKEWLKATKPSPKDMERLFNENGKLN